MSRSKKQERYSARVPWEPTPLRLADRIGVVNALYLHREKTGETWWSEGVVLFRGTAPDYLRAAYRRAQLPVTTAMHELTVGFIAVARNTRKRSPLGDPIASYQANGAGDSTTPVDVFGADPGTGAPELHVDARYVTHARRTFPLCTFWRDLVGIVQRRRRPDERRPRGVGGALR